MLFGGCNKEWHEDRRVSFGIIYDISFNQNDAIATEVDWTVEYKIIGDPNADTSTVNIADLNWRESQQYFGRESSYDHKLMSYDHLEFKVTTSSIGNAFIGLPAVNLELDFKAETFFKNFEPDDRRITETLLTINNPDTTIYFTWSPHNLPLH